jgi:integrase
MKTNYYLKSNSNKAKLIYLFFSFDGIRGKYSTGQTIEEKYWNIETQRVRKSYPDHDTLNSLLDMLESKATNIYRTSISQQKIPTIGDIREQLDKYQNKTEDKKLSFFDYWDMFIQVKTNETTFRTRQKYTTLKKHLIEFSKWSGIQITFENMNEDTYSKLIEWYFMRKKLNNTTSKEIALIKTFLHWSVSRDFNTNLKFIHAFKTFEYEKDVISLTEEELFMIYNYKTKKKYLDQVKDVFCFGCFTGLRYSDIENLTPANVKEHTLQLTTIKTKTNLTLALNIYAKQIIKKYSNNKSLKNANKLLPVISNPKTNLYLKEVCELAKINSPTQKVNYIGKQRIEETVPKYELITFHISRKTHISISLQLGMRPEVVMKNSTHSDYKSFKKYIAVADKVRQEETLKAWDRSLLKVVA